MNFATRRAVARARVVERSPGVRLSMIRGFGRLARPAGPTQGHANQARNEPRRGGRTRGTSHAGRARSPCEPGEERATTSPTEHLSRRRVSSGCGRSAVRRRVLHQPRVMAGAPRSGPRRRGGRLRFGLGRRPSAQRRGRLGRRQARGLDDDRRASHADRAGQGRIARRRQHPPQPGTYRQARDDARPPERRAGDPRAWRRLVRARARGVRNRVRELDGRAAGPARRGGRTRSGASSTESG